MGGKPGSLGDLTSKYMIIYLNTLGAGYLNKQQFLVLIHWVSEKVMIPVLKNSHTMQNHTRESEYRGEFHLLFNGYDDAWE